MSTPLPAGHAYTISLTSPPCPPSSATSPAFSDHFRRSPTPSATSVQTFTSTPSSSKYFIHVIPPPHLPHDYDGADDLDLLPPPSGASGYHTQFHRGVLVPVYSTLSSQLTAIAKEYALPSTAGLILYLILTSSAPNAVMEPEEEPGPRISEDIWRHIWHRVVKADRDDGLLSPAPRQLGLGTTSLASPSFLQEFASSSNSLRPLKSPGRIDVSQPQFPMTPSPSTASHSVFSSQSELEMPESMSSVSAGPDSARDELPLPGLNSPALIPILAKVEFDIDRRKAGWYEPWVRSRRARHSESQKRSLSRADGELISADGERRAPFDLELVERMRDDRPAFLRERDAAAAEAESEGYAELQDDLEDAELQDTSEDAELQDDAQDAELQGDMQDASAPSGDPLSDVFGTDEETWADMQVNRKRRSTNPNVVDLALDAADLSALPDESEDDDRVPAGVDEEEVTELWNSRNRPALVVSIPSPPSAGKRRSSPTTAGAGKRAPPPPLNLVLNDRPDGLAVQHSPGESNSPGSVHLAYLGADTPGAQEEEGDEGIRRARSPVEEKRDGAFFEDLDLGLVVDDDEVCLRDVPCTHRAQAGLQFDENDPYDRRRSQFIMKKQLDELEKVDDFSLLLISLLS